MKVLALVSGGKDSIFAAMEAVKYGHNIVCIGNLYPDLQISQNSEENKEKVEESTELDSYMFQTVGVEIVPLIAECTQHFHYYN
jgi:diphthine-ammonia ligase